MGVMTTTEIPFGETIGPIPPSLTLTDPAYFIGHMTLDKYPDVTMAKVDFTVMKDIGRMMEWLPFINPARNDSEMNVEVYCSGGQVYYRSIRNIYPNEQIMAWYSPEFALALGMPAVQPFYVKEDGFITCPMCNCKFRYPNTLRAHMRLKCDYRRRMYAEVNGLDLSRTLHSGRKELLHCTSDPNKNDFLNHSVGKGVSDQQPVNSHSKLKKDTPHFITNLLEDKSQKRKSEDSSNSEISLKRTKIHDSESDDGEDIDVIKISDNNLDKNQNVKDCMSHEPGACKSVKTTSAFRKVEKSNSPKQIPLRTGMTPVTESSVYTSGWSLPSVEAMPPRFQIPDKLHLVRSASYGLPSPGFPVDLRAQIPQQLSLTSSYGENFPINMRNPRFPLKAASLTQAHMLSEKTPMMQSMDRSLMAKIMPFYTDVPVPALRPPVKVNNPMVERLLSIPPLLPSSMNNLNISLTNWCAKCNATFRMTSDLVYHMRSHHQREFDPVKRKRDEKLKCNVCNESFRERHHLTRHMSSHV